MSKLSVIIPYCNEYPMIEATIRNIHEELKEIDHEIVAVDNWCEEAKLQNREPDLGHIPAKDTTMCHLEMQSKRNRWLKYMKYTERLSHWQAKKAAIAATTSPFIMFVDAHCIAGKNSLGPMFQYYEQHYQELDGTIALPLTYHLVESQRLVYKLLFDEAKGLCTFQLTNFQPITNLLVQRPCMSSCGALLTRDLYNLTGGFPQIYAYSGGEQFLNYTLAILGKKVWIYDNGTALHHHAAKRGYNFTWWGQHVNQAVAYLCFGGEKWLNKFLDAMIAKNGGSAPQREKIYNEAMALGKVQRDYLETKQVITIEEWAKNWGVK